MFFISDNVLDSLILEDLPNGDLTTQILAIEKLPGKILFTSRGEGVVSSTEEVARILTKLNATVDFFLDSGSAVKPGTLILEAHGSAQSLHAVWKTCANILEYYSAIASRTSRLISILKKHSSQSVIGGTRKLIPGTRLLAAKAVASGGGTMHRLGLSETVLIFKQHLTFFESFESIRSKVNSLRREIPERKIFIEIEEIRELESVLTLSIDGIQLDKIPPFDIQSAVPHIKSVNPNFTIIATGGINESNIGNYAACGVDVIATSSIYHGLPFDIGVTISKEGDVSS
jgi:molybdenum transport protein